MLFHFIDVRCDATLEKKRTCGINDQSRGHVGIVRYIVDYEQALVYIGIIRNVLLLFHGCAKILVASIDSYCPYI